jgi:drug/metabolite transporter (DMT)-like permease
MLGPWRSYADPFEMSTAKEVGVGPPDRPMFAIGVSVAGLGVACIQDVILKLMSGDYPLWQFAVVRSITAIMGIALILVVLKQTSQFRPNRPAMIAIRGLLTFVGYTCFYLSLASLPLADAISIFFVAPLLVTLLGVFFLGEKIRFRRATAMLVGFCGVIIMVRPGADSMEPMLLVALGAPICYSISLIITRRIGYADTGATMVLYNMLFFGLASGVGSLVLVFLALPTVEHASLAFLIRPWSVPTWGHLGLMMATGVVTAVAHYCSAIAYRSASPSLVSVFEYTYFVWAIILGYLVWQEIPDQATFIGAAVVMLSGGYIVKREAQLAGQRRAAEAEL